MIITSVLAEEVSLKVRTFIPAFFSSPTVQDHGIGLDDILGDSVTSTSSKLQSISIVLIRIVSSAFPVFVMMTLPKIFSPGLALSLSVVTVIIPFAICGITSIVIESDTVESAELVNLIINSAPELGAPVAISLADITKFPD